MDAVGSLQRERPFPLRETSFSFKGNFGFLGGETCVSLRGNSCSCPEKCSFPSGENCNRLLFRTLFLKSVSSECTFQIRSEVESGLGRLVVAYILGGYADTVHRVFEECVETVFRGNGAYV